jgi:hypothetical protein
MLTSQNRPQTPRSTACSSQPYSKRFRWECYTSVGRASQKVRWPLVSSLSLADLVSSFYSFFCSFSPCIIVFDRLFLSPPSRPTGFSIHQILPVIIPCFDAFPSTSTNVNCLERFPSNHHHRRQRYPVIDRRRQLPLFLIAVLLATPPFVPRSESWDDDEYYPS